VALIFDTSRNSDASASKRSNLSKILHVNWSADNHRISSLNLVWIGLPNSENKAIEYRPLKLVGKNCWNSADDVQFC